MIIYLINYGNCKLKSGNLVANRAQVDVFERLEGWELMVIKQHDFYIM